MSIYKVLYLQKPQLIPCDHPQVNNTDITCDNTAPHDCPHGPQHSEAKFVRINNSITVR